MVEPIATSTADRFVGTLIGAAAGDALGWPHEQRAHRVGGKSRNELSFTGWVKRSGNRFQAYEEAIEAGAYSDDTQLLIAVARARMRSSRWWDQLARTEIPFWSLYQRGGGGATLRAARALLKGSLPWEGQRTDERRYFDAGGNGVAMRVAPHVLAGLEADFDHVATDVIVDGVITHGHPRALVGALVYAFALWCALRSKGTLGFGQVLDAVVSDARAWSALPSTAKAWPEWRSAAERTFDYARLWDKTVSETLAGLEIACAGLRTGALSFDDETLTQLGCFDRKINGSGTVTAISAIFLASKHAAAPLEAVARGALAHGADTDTLASMTGALVGAVNGSSWLSPYLGQLQDADFVRGLALRLVNRPTGSDHPPNRVRAKDLEAFVDELQASGGSIELPIGVHARVEPHNGIEPVTRDLQVQAWRLRTSEGQTLVVKRVRRKPGAGRAEVSNDADFFGPHVKLTHNIGRFAGLTITVRDLRRARRLYCDALGLNVSKESAKLIQLGDHLAIRERDSGEMNGGGFTVYVSVSDLDRCRDHVLHFLDLPVSPMSDRSGRRAFACRDFDGNLLEVFQDAADASASPIVGF